VKITGVIGPSGCWPFTSGAIGWTAMNPSLFGPGSFLS
jgi:hypothetical protein